MLGLINGILGVALLVAGRRLFWLFIGALGFVTGIRFMSGFMQGPEWLTIIIAIIVGFIFAMLAVFLQTIAIGVAGFLAGGYALSVLAGMLGFDGSSWIIYILGGLIGIALVSFLFDWAIITLSSFAGASLVMESFFPEGAQIIFIILFFGGILLQGSLLRRGDGRAKIDD